jgi:hypothetical protein
MPWKIGDTVRVKDGFIDAETDHDMSGWQGRIKEFYTDAGTALIEFDSLTIQAIPSTYIRRCEEEGYSWNEYGFELEWLEATVPRDSQHDVAAMIHARSGEFPYAHLGDKGHAIDEILGDVDPDDDLEAFQVWEDHLSKHLTFPFAAAVSEFQERGSLQASDHVMVQGIEMIDDCYGVIVQVRRSRHVYHFPLCDLQVLDPSSPNHDLVQLYAVWFANR